MRPGNPAASTDKAELQHRYWDKRKDHPDAKFIRSRAWRDDLRLSTSSMRIPLCQFCELIGKVVGADQVDHKRVPQW